MFLDDFEKMIERSGSMVIRFCKQSTIGYLSPVEFESQMKLV